MNNLLPVITTVSQIGTFVIIAIMAIPQIISRIRSKRFVRNMNTDMGPEGRGPSKFKSHEAMREHLKKKNEERAEKIKELKKNRKPVRVVLQEPGEPFYEYEKRLNEIVNKAVEEEGVMDAFICPCADSSGRMCSIVNVKYHVMNADQYIDDLSCEGMAFASDDIG